MIDAIGNTSSFTIVWQYVGPLIGVWLGYLISYNVWNRQRQWEMRRDAVIEALRGLADLEYALTYLHSTFAVPAVDCTDEAREAQENMQTPAIQQFGKCQSAYMRAQIIADLAVGGQVSRGLRRYFLFSESLAQKAMSNKQSVLVSATNKERTEKRKAVILAAREALGIKDADNLPLPSDSN